MKVCLLSVEIFAWGKYGGFGRSTRLLGRELSNRGLSVAAVVPRRNGQRPVERLDGITVYGFPLRWPVAMSNLFRAIDADVYHSQHPGFGTTLALHAMPHKKHIVTFRDPKEASDWLVEFNNPSSSRFRVVLNWLYEDSPCVRRTVRQLDGRFAAAAGLDERLNRVYRFRESLNILPTPIPIPPNVAKSSTPLVVFVGRLDRRKRPEDFFRLAKRFPDVDFIAVGQAQDTAFDRTLRNHFGTIPNLNLAGFIDQFRTDELDRLLGRAWIIANTAAREGMPTSLLEAAAHRCAILSYVNPDRIAERFGYHAADYNFGAGLSWLLENNRWRELGEAGYRYVRESHELERAVDRHIETYRKLLTPDVAAAVEQQ